MTAYHKSLPDVVDEAAGRLAVVLEILNAHEDRCSMHIDGDETDGWDLRMAIEALRGVRESLREVHADATATEKGGTQ